MERKASQTTVNHLLINRKTDRFPIKEIFRVCLIQHDEKRQTQLELETVFCFHGDENRIFSRVCEPDSMIIHNTK